VCLPIGTGSSGSWTTPAPADGPNSALPAVDGEVMGACAFTPTTPAPPSILSLILLATVALLRTRRERR
jgi:MYXO-CTERM domain-containing protein